MNWNTILNSCFFAAACFISREFYQEMRATHDAVLSLKITTVSRSEFDVQMSDVRARLSAVEIEIQKLKDRR